MARKTPGKKSKNSKQAPKASGARAAASKKPLAKPASKSTLQSKSPKPPVAAPRKPQSFTIKLPPRPGKPQPATAAQAKKPSKSALELDPKKKGRSVAEVAAEVKADSKGYVFINGRRVRMISTKGMAPIKRQRDNGDLANAEAQAAIAIKSIKTKLGRKELNEYRDMLVTKRRELIGDLDAMETQALRSGGGNLSHMPIHMADIGTDTYDQDFMLGLAETERKQLREIDEALQRIEDRTFGVCQSTGEQIPKARLDAKPWAKYTVEAARKLEGDWGRG